MGQSTLLYFIGFPVQGILCLLGWEDSPIYLSRAGVMQPITW